MPGITSQGIGVPLSTPTALCVDQRLLITLRALLEVADPEEGCALLLGSRQEHAWTLEQLWPCCNVWPAAGERHRRFAVDPREQLVAQRWGRGRGLQVLGVAHRHPCSAAIPSRADCRLCVPPALMVIQGESGALQAWWLEAGTAQPRPLPWRMVD